MALSSIMDYFNQESERLIFRKVTSDDIPAWLSFFPNNDSIHVAQKNGMHILRETHYLGMDVYVFGTKEINS